MEEQSPQINELATALAKAQSEMKGAKKDSENPFFHSTYADLASNWEACRGPLTKNGLAVIQSFRTVEGKMELVTRLVHSSGQWVMGSLPVTSIKQDPQGIVAAITYFRRAALAAFVGIAPTDDDGEEAMARPQNTQAATKPPSKELSEKQIKRLFAISKTAGWTNDELRNFMNSEYGVISTNELSWAQYDKLCKHIETNPIQDFEHHQFLESQLPQH